MATGLKHYAAAADVCEKVYGPEHLETVKWRSDQAVALGDLGRFQESEAIHRKVLDRRRAALGPNHEDTLISMNNLALALARLGKRDESLQLREETLRLAKVHFGPNHRITMFVLYNLSQSYIAVRRFEDALRAARESLEARTAALGATNPETLRSMMAVSYCLNELGRVEEAAKLNAETLQLQTTAVGRGHPDALMTAYNLAENLISLRRGAEAVSLIDESVTLADGKSLEYPYITMSLELRSKYARGLHDPLECRKSAELREKYAPTDPQGLYQAACLRAILASVLQSRKGTPAAKEADANAERGMDWLKKAVKAGFRNVEHLKKDEDLEALRNRPDFGSLLKDLESEAAAKSRAKRADDLGWGFRDSHHDQFTGSRGGIPTVNGLYLSQPHRLQPFTTGN
jgi:tetratricopeptide (TPR) repeat protein